MSDLFSGAQSYLAYGKMALADAVIEHNQLHLSSGPRLQVTLNID